MVSQRIYPRFFVTCILFVIVSLLAQSILPGVSAAPPLAPQAQTGTPPVLVESSPANGASWNGEPLRLIFDQPMDAQSADHLRVEPALAGERTVAENMITFTPSEPLTAGVRYQVTLLTEATGANGIQLSTPVALTLVAVSPLQVTSTQPADHAEDVTTASQIVIVFNRPVAPLTGIDDQAELPQPLTIEPAVEGVGHWLNTSVYAFQPTLGLAGGTAYQITVNPITGLGGESLAEAYTFRFTTAAPIVVDAMPQGNQVPPDSVVTVTFSQPMDRASAAAAFSLVKTSGNGEPTPVEGAIHWDAASTTLTFSPTQWLEFDAGYTVRVANSAQPASRRGALREAFERDFDVLPLPAVEVTTPLDGEQNAPPDINVVIRFNTPLSYTTVLPNIRVTPLVSTTQVYSYYAEYNNEVMLSWFKEANTQYTVTIGSAIADKYGNQLGQDLVFRFTTGDHPPFTRINLDRFTHFSAYTTTNVSINYRNVELVEAELFRVPLNEFLKLTSQNQWEFWQNYRIPDRTANRIWSRSYASRVGRNITAQQIISLTGEGGELLAPGLYLLEVKQPQITPDTMPAQALIVLSNYNLTLKKSQHGQSIAWLTDLRSGQPMAGQSVSFYLEQKPLATAVTDADGIASAQWSLTPENSYWPVRALSGEPGQPTFAAVSSEWNNGVAIWDFGLNGGYSPEHYQLHFYTDRPIYRPGQTIYWKGIVRVLEEEEYSLPPEGGELTIIVRDDQGNAVKEEGVALNANGTVTGQVELASTAVTGFYYLEARLPVGERTVYGGAGFQVAAYRKPEFQIEVAPDQPEYVQGDSVRIQVQANYFSGGALGNAPVAWRLIADPYYFNWANAPTNRYFSFTPYDPEQTDYDPYRQPYYGLLQEGLGTTGVDGSFVIELSADLQESLQSQNWSFDVTVQSPTNQFVSGRTTAPVHKGDFYIGLSPQQYVVTVGDQSGVDVVTVTPQGEPYPGAKLTAVVYEFVWNSVYERAADGSYRWESTALRTPVLTTTVTTDRSGTATLTWTPKKGGQYQIVADGEDEAGNTISSATYVYVSERDVNAFVAWPRENNDRIKLVADKQLYQPGDTAKILAPSPFRGPIRALLNLERSGVLESKLMTLQGNSPIIEVPITAAHIPNIFVSIILVKGVDESNPFPAMRVGYVQLNVDTSQKELSIEVTPSAQQVKPGATVTYTLLVKNSGQRPVANAEVSVALVDKAVLSLAFGDHRSLLDIFYYQRPLGVATGVLLAINKDRLSQQLSEGAKGGGGGGPGGSLEIRQDFPDIAYWRADLTTDANGQIVFGVELPDNLTTWSLAAKAITTDTLVGETTHEIVATKALQVRPLLPRFFTAGDRAKIGALVLNTTPNEVADLHFTLDLAGATLEGGAGERSAHVAANGQARFDFPISIQRDSSTVVVTMTADAGVEVAGEPLRDALRLELPVLRYETPEVVATSGVVPAEGRSEAIRLPSAATEQSELSVVLEPSLAAGLLDGLHYLEHYQYECNEQTVSRFLPNLFTVQALRKLKIENPALENTLSYQLGIGVQRLVSRQNTDGGWGYWPGQDSTPFVSSYVLWGLASADAMGYTVPQQTLENAVNYLEGRFQAPKDVQSNWLLNELAFMNFVLAEMGRGDPGRASTLYDVRERLGLYGQALLAMTLADIATQDATTDERVDTLLDNLFGAAQLSATGAFWQEDSTDWWTFNTDTRTTSMVLAAFARLDSTQPLLPQVVRWLMSARKAGRWATTQENAWAIIALTDWLAASGELEGEYAWTALLNGNELGRGVVTPVTVDSRFELRAAVVDLLADQANLLLINRSNASGQLYYTTHLRYYLDALAIDARDRGLVVDRHFTLDGQRVSSAKVGDVVSVTVTIVAPTNLYHVLVEAPIPAGVEPIDLRLATTSNQFGGPTLEPVNQEQRWWYFWTPSYIDIRDDKVALFATELPAGAYEYTFQVRASLPGEYRVLPAYGEMMYFNEVWGRSAGALFTVSE
jgi:hypothetical protein